MAPPPQSFGLVLEDYGRGVARRCTHFSGLGGPGPLVATPLQKKIAGRVSSYINHAFASNIAPYIVEHQEEWCRPAAADELIYHFKMVSGVGRE